MLKDKVVFISGGTGYVGSAICRLCASYGAKVMFSYNSNDEKAEALASEINGKAFKLDMRDVDDIARAFKEINSELDTVDILINNASASQIMPLAMLEPEDVDFIFDINIKGTLFFTREVVRYMVRNRKGSIVNIGSIAGDRMLDVPVTYAMSKAAITGMTTSLAREFRKFNIRVNTVIPGMLEGGVAGGIPDDLKEQFLKHCIAGRAGTATEVAETVCFLASEKASYINGQHINVNGGI